MNWKTEKEIVLNAAREMSQKGLVTGTMGNVSLRLHNSEGKELIAITPSNQYYTSLTVDDIVIINYAGEIIEGNLKPSTEKLLHARIYQKRQKVNAIIHFHSIFSSILSVAFKNIPPILDDQVICLGGEIQVADYAFSGSRELDANVIKALGDNNAVILANHGALSVGSSIRDAFTNCEMLEKTSQIYVNASTLGKVNKLSVEAIEKGRCLFNQGYGNC
jgi:L-fuculose-phosphate aldolase